MIARMIALAVLFCAIMIAWMVLIVLAIPFRVGINYVSPVKFHRALWNILWNKILLPLFILIIVLLFVLYLVYKALEPIFIIGSIIQAMSPFVEMRNLCIISFFDKLIALIPRLLTDPITGLREFKDACMCVLVKSLETLGDEVSASYTPPGLSYNASSVNTTANNGTKSFTKAEYDQIKDEELQCILESTSPVANDASQTDRLRANAQNQASILKCKMQSIAQSFKVLAQASRN